MFFEQQAFVCQKFQIGKLKGTYYARNSLENNGRHNHDYDLLEKATKLTWDMKKWPNDQNIHESFWFRKNFGKVFFLEKKHPKTAQSNTVSSFIEKSFLFVSFQKNQESKR